MDTATAPPLADLPPDYAPVMPPYAHQRTALVRSWRKRRYGLFMEQGLGKTKVVYDTCVLHYRRDIINALLVAAPNDVHAQWIDEQLPKHWPKNIATRAVIWDANSVKANRLAKELITKPLPGRFTILAMNSEALSTKKGRAIAKAFLRAYKCMFCIDESHDFAVPKAARTKFIQEVRELAVVRRICTGTPKTQTPFSLYSQFKFLDPRILQFDTYLAFKHHYGVWQTEHKLLPPRMDPKTKKMVRPLHEYETLQEYQRLNELYSRVDPYCYRITKEQCVDLPPKIPVTRYTSLSPAQAKLYDTLRDEGLLMLAEAEQGKPVQPMAMEELNDEDFADYLMGAQEHGVAVTTTIKLTLMLRLHQLVGGFIKGDDGITRCVDGTPDKCPRMAATLQYATEALESSPMKVIIWAVYKAELAALEGLLPAYDVVRVDGTVTGKARKEAIAAFKDTSSSVRVLIAHPRTMGTGQDLPMAGTAIYYSNSWRYILRAQSEDRIHRIGITGSPSICDIRNRDTDLIDNTILEALAGHSDVARQFMTFNAAQLREVL
jgi:hypothetical protein